MNNNLALEGISFFEESKAPAYKFEVNPRQWELYTDTCEKKKVTAKPVEAFSSPKQLAQEIAIVKELPDPISPPQVELIMNTYNELVELGTDKVLTEQQVLRLTKDKASELIQKMFAERDILAVNAPATRDQIITIATWYICPDIPFEDYGISKIVYLDELKSWTYTDDRGTGHEVLPYRQMTAREFGYEIQRVFKKTDAQDFINKYSKEYYKWKKSRITDGQVTKIKYLQDRMFYKSNVQQSVWNPETQEYTVYTNKGTADYEGIEYEPMSERDMRQLSKDEASKIINMLQMEIDDETLRSLNPYDNAQEAFTTKHSSYNSNQRDNKYSEYGQTTYHTLPKNTEDAYLSEYEALVDIVTWAEIVNGQRNDELKDKIGTDIITSNSFQSKLICRQIEDFLIMTIDKSTTETVKQSLTSIYSAVERSEIGLKLHANIVRLFNL